MSRPWSTQDISTLSTLYSSESIQSIANMLGRSFNSVKLKANRMGLKKKERTKLNTSYFHKIDSPEKAYWIGFIIADGNVCANEHRGSFELSIELSSVDEGHLNKLIRALDAEYSVCRRIRTPFKNEGNYKSYQTSFVRIYSRELVEDLISNGVVPNKTNEVIVSDINFGGYTWDFIRGYFDGDGSISRSLVTSTSGVEHIYPRIGFVAKSKDLILSLRDTLVSYDIHPTIFKDRGNWTLSIRKQSHVWSFCESMYYSEDCVRLDRKYEKYKEIYTDCPRV